MPNCNIQQINFPTSSSVLEEGETFNCTWSPNPHCSGWQVVKFELIKGANTLEAVLSTSSVSVNTGTKSLTIPSSVSQLADNYRIKLTYEDVPF